MDGSPPARPGLWARIRAWQVSPPTFALLIVVLLLAGGVGGLGFFTLFYAHGLSYLSDDPSACANCHIMREVYDGWNHGSHKAVAVCNDCHIPRDFVSHYALKAYDGLNHSLHFTLNDFPEPIEISSLDRQVAYQNCLNCHGDLVTPISHLDAPDPTDCIRCHREVGHPD